MKQKNFKSSFRQTISSIPSADLSVNMKISAKVEAFSLIKCRLKHVPEQPFRFFGYHFKPREQIAKKGLRQKAKNTEMQCITILKGNFQTNYVLGFMTRSVPKTTNKFIIYEIIEKFFRTHTSGLEYNYIYVIVTCSK